MYDSREIDLQHFMSKLCISVGGVAWLVTRFVWNKVTLCRAWLVLWWVSACGQVNHLGVKPAS